MMLRIADYCIIASFLLASWGKNHCTTPTNHLASCPKGNSPYNIVA